ncbi:MAG TPA: AraC family transcriptional regulator [Pseudonocardiaceae bacterium]|nr:AraC family transcriptional regulator [Pseudonocardiaceae bacterium]
MTPRPEQSVRPHRFETSDPEEAHGFIRRIYADHRVCFSGSQEGFSFVHTSTTARGFSIGRMRHGMAVELEGDPLEGMLVIDHILSGSLELSVGGDAVRADRAALTLSQPERRWRCAWDNLDVGLVTLERAMVAEYAADASGVDPAGLTFTGMTPVSPRMAQHWQAVVRHVSSDILPNAEAMASPLVGGQTARLLAGAVLATFPNNALDALASSAPAGAIEPTALRRAVEFIDAHAGEDIGITEIAEAARVGPRGLQQAFRRYRDLTPMEYLRWVRLEHAHRALRAGDPARGDTVAAIATRWGFPHTGRFSAEYRRAYGCSPSQTLRQ